MTAKTKTQWKKCKTKINAEKMISVDLEGLSFKPSLRRPHLSNACETWIEHVPIQASA